MQSDITFGSYQRLDILALMVNIEILEQKLTENARSDFETAVHKVNQRAASK